MQSRAIVVASVIASLAALTGCSDLLGIEDRLADDAEGGQTSNVSAATASSGSDASTGSAPSTSGVGGAISDGGGSASSATGDGGGGAASTTSGDGGSGSGSGSGDGGDAPGPTTGEGGAGGAEVPCSPDLDTDPDHCGACDHGCLGGDCEDGRCQPYALNLPLTVAEYKHLRVENGPDGAIYFARWRIGTVPAGVIWRLQKSAAQVSTYVEALPDWGWVGDVQIDDEYVYYSSYSDHDSLASRGVYRLLRAGGEPEQLVSDTPDEPYTGTSFLRLDGDDVFFNTWYGDIGIGLVSDAGAVTPIAAFAGPSPHYDMAGSFEIDAEWAYCGIADLGVVRYSRDGGGEPELLYDEGAGFPNFNVLAIDDAHVYWQDHDGVVRRGPKAGGGPVEVVTPTCGRAFHLAGGYAYLSTPDGKTIVRKPLDDLDAEPEIVLELDEGTETVSEVALDENSLYWLGYGTGIVYRLAL